VPPLSDKLGGLYKELSNALLLSISKETNHKQTRKTHAGTIGRRRREGPGQPPPGFQQPTGLAPCKRPRAEGMASAKRRATRTNGNPAVIQASRRSHNAEHSGRKVGKVPQSTRIADRAASLIKSHRSRLRILDRSTCGSLSRGSPWVRDSSLVCPGHTRNPAVGFQGFQVRHI
jgi:hypothetical protein